MLIEAAWSYRFPARISREQLLRQEGPAKPIRDTARKAQERLCRRYRKLARAGKSPTVVTTAIARELTGFAILLAALTGWAAATLSVAAEDKAKVELIVTLSGPPAVLGGQVRDGFIWRSKRYAANSAGSMRK